MAVVSAVLFTGTALVAWAVPAGASPHATGTARASSPPVAVVPGVSLESESPAQCSGGGTVLDSSGQVLDHATAPGGGGASPDNPIIVDPSGTVTYHGTSGTPITDHTWEVRFEGFMVKSGGSANDGKKTDTAGTEPISNYLPGHILTGTYYVDGYISGTGGGCTGSAYVKLNGSPFVSVAFYVMLLFLLIALFLFSIGMPDAAEDYLDMADDLDPTRAP